MRTGAWRTAWSRHKLSAADRHIPIVWWCRVQRGGGEGELGDGPSRLTIGRRLVALLAAQAERSMQRRHHQIANDGQAQALAGCHIKLRGWSHPIVGHAQC